MQRDIRADDELLARPAPADDKAFAVATLARVAEWAAASADPWDQTNGFRLLDIGHDEVRWKDGEREVAIVVRRRRDGMLDLDLPGGRREAGVQRLADGRLAIRLGGDTFSAAVVRRQTSDGLDYTLFTDSTSRRLRLVAIARSP